MVYVYMIRCKDCSLYTGITSDLSKRMKEHFYQKPECAKYTKSHQMVKLEMCWSCETRSEAAKLEYVIKRFSKVKKEKIVLEPESLPLLEFIPEGKYRSFSKKQILECMNEIKKMN